MSCVLSLLIGNLVLCLIHKQINAVVLSTIFSLLLQTHFLSIAFKRRVVIWRTEPAWISVVTPRRITGTLASTSYSIARNFYIVKLTVFHFESGYRPMP